MNFDAFDAFELVDLDELLADADDEFVVFQHSVDSAKQNLDDEYFHYKLNWPVMLAEVWKYNKR